MLTLNTGSVCDVCSDEYGAHCLPHSIPCGHVLCSNCSNTIIEKTSARLSPACPFCREPFDSDSIRLIRIDFSASRWSTPRLKSVPLHPADDSTVPASHEDRIVLKPFARSREEARRLEHKVAKVAVKKCSVEEVSTLHKELTQWLMSDVKSDDQLSSLSLSAALLRAILTNHLAHSEAIRASKNVELDLQAKLDDAEISIGKLEAELRRHKALYAQKVQECQTLCSEMNRLKLITTTLGLPPSRSGSSSPTHESRHQSTLPPSTSPTPSSTTYGPTSASPLSRYNSTHSTHTRSVSMSSRPTTPAPPPRSHTPAPRSHTPSLRSQTPAPRSQTPSIRSSFRPETPAPPLPTSPAHLTHSYHSSPPPPTSSEFRRLSQTPGPPKMSARTVSEEKEHAKVHQRWIPPPDPDLFGPPNYAHQAHGLARPASAAPGSRGISSAAAQAQASRYTSPISAT